jgi:hypothetical protein
MSYHNRVSTQYINYGRNYKYSNKVLQRIPNDLFKVLKIYVEEKEDQKSKDFKYPNFNESFQYIIKNLKKQNVKTIKDLESILINDSNDKDIDTLCNNSNQQRILLRNEFKQILKIIIESEKEKNSNITV